MGKTKTALRFDIKTSAAESIHNAWHTYNAKAKNKLGKNDFYGALFNQLEHSPSILKSLLKELESKQDNK